MQHPHAVQATAFVRALLCLVVFAVNSHSAPLWVATYNSTSNAQDVAENIVRAIDGSLYVSGFSGPQDGQKAVVVKYGASGQQLWAVENTNISRLVLFQPLPLTAVDSGGGLRLAGKWAPSGNEIALVNYSAEGSLLWERHFREGVESYAHVLTVDASGNTIVVGWCKTNAAPDALILKYAPDGTVVWKRLYSFPAFHSEQAFSVTTLPNGDSLVGISSQWQGPVILKFSADGELLWTAEPGGELPWQLITDASGNILVSTMGFFEDDLLIKLNSSGQVLWSVSDDFSESRIALDAEGNVYTTSPSRGLIVAKYNANGVRQWTSRFSMDNDYASAAVGITAHQGGVSIGFNFFDLSVPVHRFSAAHYDSNGVEVWRETHSQTGGSASAMVGDSGGGIYLTGFRGSPNASSIQTMKFQVAVPPSLPQIIVAAATPRRDRGNQPRCVFSANRQWAQYVSMAPLGSADTWRDQRNA